jgi:hypothetical protein
MVTRKSVQAEKRTARAATAVRTAEPATGGTDASACPTAFEQLALRLPVNLDAASPGVSPVEVAEAGKSAGRGASSRTPGATARKRPAVPGPDAPPGRGDRNEGSTSLVPAPVPHIPNGVRHGFGDLRAALAEGWEIVQPIFARPLWSAPDDSATAFSFVLRGPHGTRLITVPQGRTVERFIRDRRLAVDYAR